METTTLVMSYLGGTWGAIKTFMILNYAPIAVGLLMLSMLFIAYRVFNGVDAQVPEIKKPAKSDSKLPGKPNSKAPSNGGELKKSNDLNKNSDESIQSDEPSSDEVPANSGALVNGASAGSDRVESQNLNDSVADPETIQKAIELASISLMSVDEKQDVDYRQPALEMLALNDDANVLLNQDASVSVFDSSVTQDPEGGAQAMIRPTGQSLDLANSAAS